MLSVCVTGPRSPTCMHVTVAFQILVSQPCSKHYTKLKQSNGFLSFQWFAGRTWHWQSSQSYCVCITGERKSRPAPAQEQLLMKYFTEWSISQHPRTKVWSYWKMCFTALQTGWIKSKRACRPAFCFLFKEWLLMTQVIFSLSVNLIMFHANLVFCLYEGSHIYLVLISSKSSFLLKC